MAFEPETIARLKKKKKPDEWVIKPDELTMPTKPKGQKELRYAELASRGLTRSEFEGLLKTRILETPENIMAQYRKTAQRFKGFGYIKTIDEFIKLELADVVAVRDLGLESEFAHELVGRMFPDVRERLAQTGQQPEIPLPELDLSELFKRVYPEFDFETEQGEVTLDIMMQWAEEDPNAFIADIQARGRTPETIALLEALEATPEEVERVFFEPEPFEIPAGGMSFVEEVEGIKRLYTISEDYLVEVDGEVIGKYRPETGQISPQVVAPLDGIRQLLTIDTDTMRAYNQQGNWVGTYDYVTQEFTKLPEESKAKDIWDAFYLGGQNLYQQSKQFVVSALPESIFGDVSPKFRELYGDELADNVDEKQREIRDKFRQVYSHNQDVWEDWVTKHPEYAPRPEWRKGALDDPSILKDPAYWLYEFASTVPFMIAVMGTTVGVTAATGNPVLGVMAGMSAATVAQTQDIYEALLTHEATEEQAGQLALPIGVLVSGIEVIGDMPYLRQAFPRIFKLFTKEIGDQLAKRTVSELLKKKLRLAGTVWITETLEEGAQEVTINAGIKVIDENHSLIEGLDETLLRAGVAMTPFALGVGAIGGGMSLGRVSPSQTTDLTDTQMEAKGWQKDPETGNWYQPLELPSGVEPREAPTVPVIPEVVPEVTVDWSKVTFGYNITKVSGLKDKLIGMIEELPLDIKADIKAVAVNAERAREIGPMVKAAWIPQEKTILFRRVEDITPYTLSHELGHSLLEESIERNNVNLIRRWLEATGEKVGREVDVISRVEIPRIEEDFAESFAKYIRTPNELTSAKLSFFEEFYPKRPEVEVAKPPVVKVPEIPEVIGEGGIPVPPEEPIPQGVVDSTPIIGDIGAKELVRPTRKVFERLGLFRLHKGIQRAEVLVGEERVARQKEQREVMKSVGKDKDRWALIFDEVNKKGSVVGLTFNEKRAVAYIRNWANEWADRKNLPKEKRIKDYIPHLFEQEMIAEIKETGKISPELAMLLSDRVAKHITDPFLKERLGAVGFLKDPFRAMEAYDAAAMRVFYYEPFLQKIAAIGNDINTPHAVRDYMKDYSRRMTGEPNKLDTKINADIQELASKLKGLPGGEAFASYLEKGNVSGFVAYQFTGAIYALWLGFKPTSAIRNLSQHTLIIGEVGPVHFADAIRMRFTKEGKAALGKSLVLRSRKAAFVPGIDDSFAEQWTDKFRETALYMFRWADRQNVSDAFLAGYSEAKSLLPDADEQVWIDRGDEVAADTQYLYTKMNSMAISQSSVGRVFSILTTWTENWIELMSKWIARRPSQVYLEHERETGEKVAGANWSTSVKAILIYMVIIGLGFAVKERTRLKAWEYTGITSIRYLADVVGGDFPGLQGPGAIANMVAGFITDDDRMFKEGWYDFKSTFTPGIIKQLNAVMAGDKDWLTLLLYLEGRNYKFKQLKSEWREDYKAYPLFKDEDGEYDPDLKREWIRTHPEQAGWSDAKIRNQWREDNPKLEAKMFIVSQFSTLSTDEARAEVLRLIEKHDLNTEMIDGYEKVFGVDTAVELDKFQNRVGNLEKLVAGEEAEYFTVGNFVTEVNKAVKTQGRVKVEKDGNQLAIAVLRAQDSFVQYDSLEEAGARKLFRQQFPDVEAWMYLMGKVQSFENPKSAEILLGLMKKYDIPPEGIRAFIEKPERYDELFTQKFILEQKWFDQTTQYENYSNPESDLYIEDKDERADARDKFKEDNPDWVADMRRIEAIDNDAPPEIMEKWVDRGKTIDEFSAGSSQAMVWLLDNPETHVWALEKKLLTDDGKDWNEPVLRLNVKWHKQDEEYAGFGDSDAPNYIEDDGERLKAREQYLLARPEYNDDRRRKAMYSLDAPEGIIEEYVEYGKVVDEFHSNSAEANLFRLDHPNLSKFGEDEETLDWEAVDKDKEPIWRIDVKYAKEDAEYQAILEKYVGKDETEATEAYLYKNGQPTEYCLKRYERSALRMEFPKEQIKNYVSWYTNPKFKKPDGWKDKTGTDLWYEDEWFLMENKAFYQAMLAEGIFTERRDFRDVPTRKVFGQYLGYLDESEGKQRMDYRFELWMSGEKDFENWLVEAKDYTPIVGQVVGEANLMQYSKEEILSTLEGIIDREYIAVLFPLSKEDILSNLVKPVKLELIAKFRWKLTPEEIRAEELAEEREELFGEMEEKLRKLRE